MCYCVIVFVVSLQHNINSLWNSSRKLDLSLTVFSTLISPVLEMHGMIIKIGVICDEKQKFCVRVISCLKLFHFTLPQVRIIFEVQILTYQSEKFNQSEVKKRSFFNS